jgi:hypothetical protein
LKSHYFTKLLTELIFFYKKMTLMNLRPSQFRSVEGPKHQNDNITGLLQDLRHGYRGAPRCGWAPFSPNSLVVVEQ